MLAFVGHLVKPLACLRVYIPQIGERAQRPEVLANISDSRFHLSFIEKRALQTVAMMQHKFSPSRTLFIR
jgi:hypothetical protein